MADARTTVSRAARVRLMVFAADGALTDGKQQ